MGKGSENMSKQSSQKYKKEKDRKFNDKISDSTSNTTGSVKDQSGTKGASNKTV
jgi:hypothetical protein